MSYGGNALYIVPQIYHNPTENTNAPEFPPGRCNGIQLIEYV